MKEFKVDVTPLMKKLELVSRKGISGFLSGEFRSVFKGRGLEFTGYRNYNPEEDDARNIDWKASMRSRYLVVKELVEERNNNVVFFIDVSSTMSFGSTDKLKNEYVIEMFASMAHSLLTGGDSVGLALFSDKLVTSIQPNIGNKQYYMMLKTITNPQYYEGKFDFGEALHQLNAMLTRRSIIIMISDFIGLKGDWYEKMRIVAARHEVIVFIVKDPRDIIMPEEVGQVFVEDPITGESLLIDTKIVKEQYERLAHEEDQKLMKLFNDIQVEYMFITTNQPFNKVLFKFFKERALRFAVG
jgi:uncharacterized protein (DUF58 family)